MNDRAARICDYVLQGGLLIAVLVVPAYFNIDDQRIFEPDKAILLRDLAAVLAAVWLLRQALRALAALRSPAPRPRSAAAPLDYGHSVGHAPRRWPTLLPMLLLTATTLLATATSLLPDVSWNGSYARGQGALTTLAYLTMALLALDAVRQAAQAQRLGTAIALSGLVPAAYGWVQHFGRDPLPWQQADLAQRVPGTLGNPIFLGALLVMTLPLALYRLALALGPRPTGAAGVCSGIWPGIHLADRAWRLWRCVAALGWAAVVVVEAGGLLFTKSRGPFAGLLVAMVVFGLALGRAWNLHRLRRGSVAAGSVIAAVLLGANLLATGALGHIGETSGWRLLQWTPSASGSSEVRLLIWRPALTLVAQRPLLGCGPDVLQYCYYPVYPAALRHIEAPNAVPDRTHNILLDAAVETGLLGLGALLALLIVTARRLAKLSKRAADPAQRALAAALLAALAGHVAEGFFGIAVVATALLTWLIAGLAGALAALEQPQAPAAGAANGPNMWPYRRWALPPMHLYSLWRLPVAAPSWSLAATLPAGPAGLAWPAQRGRRRAIERAYSEQAAGHSRRRALIGAALAWAGCFAAALLAWQIVTAGSAAMAADAAARQGADLEAMALANSGQAPLPTGRSPQPVLGLRQFSAAAQHQAGALHLAPRQEEYWLDAGNILTEWAQAAGEMGGPAAAQAPAIYANALLDFGRAARLNPYDPDALRNTGKAYERWAGLGHDPANSSTWDHDLLARAAQAFARAAVLAPHHPDPLTSWAQVALWQGQPSQALALANRALALDALDGDGYRLRADAAYALGRRRAALAGWRRALADPNLSRRGPMAARLALAEATWAQVYCTAVRDARIALANLAPADAQQMREIVYVDTARCHGSPTTRRRHRSAAAPRA